MGGHGRMHWGPSCSQSRAQEGRGRHRLSTVIQPLRQSASEVVDLTVDEDGKDTGLYEINKNLMSSASFGVFPSPEVFLVDN